MRIATKLKTQAQTCIGKISSVIIGAPEKRKEIVFIFEVALFDLGAAARFLVHFFFVCFHLFFCAKSLTTTLIVLFLCATGHLTISPTFVSTMF
jgi:hypothetical protein